MDHPQPTMPARNCGALSRALRALACTLALFTSCTPLGAELEDEEAEQAEDTDSALHAPEVAQIAIDNLGKTACGTNSLGGQGYYSSCTGNGGYPEYWCSDFAKWVWKSAGAKVTGLTPAAGSF
jgi:hypothetical protein